MPTADIGGSQQLGAGNGVNVHDDRERIYGRGDRSRMELNRCVASIGPKREYHGPSWASLLAKRNKEEV